MQNRVQFSKDGARVTAILPGDIDHHLARSLREQIDRELEGGGIELLILDFSAVRFMDSSGIGLIIGRCELAGRYGARVRLKGLSESLVRLVRLCGIEKIKNLSIG